MDRDVNIVTLKARFVVPSPGEVIEGGKVVVQGDKIRDVGTSRQAGGVEVDLGDAVIIPGLI
ncbi:MAG: hypothetical protein J3T61_04810, partial [Candidatus Brocadiales bacterium]|nr:hypothetical protein [Candidatus Bathyanammoxibius sp.]